MNDPIGIRKRAEKKLPTKSENKEENKALKQHFAVIVLVMINPSFK